MSDKKVQHKAIFLAPTVGIILYVALDAIVQILPPHYSPIRQAESDLAVGPYGYIMAINFVNRGVLSLLFVFGLYKVAKFPSSQEFRIGAALLSIWGVGAIVLAAFPTDLPGTPVTLHGEIHLLTAAIAFIGGAFGVLLLSIDFAKQGKSLSEIRKYVLPVGIISPILAFVTFGGLSTQIGGLLERLFLGSVLLWILIISLYIYKEGT